MLAVKRTDEPVVRCEAVNSGANDYKILIVGESWASDGRIFPELPKFASARLDDVADASVVLLAWDGDVVVTSDTADIAVLAGHLGRSIAILPP